MELERDAQSHRWVASSHRVRKYGLGRRIPLATRRWPPKSFSPSPHVASLYAAFRIGPPTGGRPWSERPHCRPFISFVDEFRDLRPAPRRRMWWVARCEV